MNVYKPWFFMILKTFLVTTITYTLVLSPVALAKESSQNDPSSDQALNVQFSQQHTANTAEAAKGSKGRDGALKWANMQQWLTLANSLVIGYLAASIIRTCPKMSMDTIIAAAAGVTYIGAEILATAKDKKLREEIEKEHKKEINAKSQDVQVQALEAQKKAYDELAKTAATKKMLQYAAAAAFLVAAGIAYMEMVREEAAFTACQSALASSQAALPAACPPHVPGCAAVATTCGGAISVAQADLLLAKEKRNLPDSPSSIKVAELTASQAKQEGEMAVCKGHPGVLAAVTPSEAACKGYFTNVIGSMTVCNKAGWIVGDRSDQDFVRRFAEYIDTKIEATPAFKADLKPEERGLFKEAVKRIFLGGMNFLFPKAQASLLKNMGIVGAGAGIILSLLFPMKQLIDHWINQPRNRAIMWGALGASVGAAGFMSGKIEAEMKANSKEIAELLAKYRAKAHQNQVTPGGGKLEQQSIPWESLTTKPIVLGDSAESGIPCLTKKNGKGECAKLPTFSPEQQERLKGFDPGVAGLAQSALKVGAGLNNAKTISSGTLGEAASLAGKAAFVSKRLKQAKKGFFEGLEKKSGPGAVAKFKGLEEGFRKQLSKNAFDAFKKHGVEPGPLLASQRLGEGLSRGEQKGERLAKAKLRTTGGAGLKVLGSKGARVKNKGDAMEFKFDFKEEAEKPAETGSAVVAQIDEEKLDLELEEDISKDRNADIFRMISLRYRKTAYPVLFDEL